MTERAVRAWLTFPEELVTSPVIARLAIDYAVIANIRRANVEEHAGWIVCELEGTDEAIDAGVAWLTSAGVKVDWLGGQVEG